MALQRSPSTWTKYSAPSWMAKEEAKEDQSTQCQKINTTRHNTTRNTTQLNSIQRKSTRLFPSICAASMPTSRQLATLESTQQRPALNAQDPDRWHGVRKSLSAAQAEEKDQTIEGIGPIMTVECCRCVFRRL